jgi:hypothetical protein
METAERNLFDALENKNRENGRLREQAVELNSVIDRQRRFAAQDRTSLGALFVGVMFCSFPFHQIPYHSIGRLGLTGWLAIAAWVYIPRLWDSLKPFPTEIRFASFRSRLQTLWRNYKRHFSPDFLRK